MKDHKTRNILLIVGTVITAILAVVVIVVSTQLQQKGSTPVAPNVPVSQPQAAVPEACSLSFTPTFPALPNPSCASNTAFKNVASNKVDANKIGTYDLSAANALAPNAVVQPGDIIVYHLKGVLFDNNQIGSVFWTDTLGAKLTFMDSSLGGDCTATVNADTTTKIQCKVADVKPSHPDPSALYEVTIRAQVKTGAAAGVMNNQAIVGISPPPSTQSTMCAIALTVAAPGVAACTSKTAFLDKTSNTPGFYDVTPANAIASGATVTRGQQFVYWLKGSTLTSDATADIIWTDTLDSRLDFVDATTGCTHTTTAPIVVTCNRGKFKAAAGADYSVGIRVKVKAAAAAGSFTNTATVKTGGANANTCAIPLSLSPVSCNNSCTTDTDCSTGLKCISNSCRNNACSTKTDCVCTTPTPTPSPSPSPSTPPGTGFYILKYNDTNGDGARQNSEAGLTWSFQWQLNSDGTWHDYATSDTTDGHGGNIGNLKGGDKVAIRELSKDGWSSTTPSSYDSLTMEIGVIKKVEFGNRQKTAVGCNNSCVTDSDCASGLSCASGMCRNNACSAKTNCVCDVTSTATPTLIAQATPTPTAQALPKSGSTSETIGTIAVGAVITVLGVIGLFAL